jgi:hypothetical protein
MRYGGGLGRYVVGRLVAAVVVCVALYFVRHWLR